MNDIMTPSLAQSMALLGVTTHLQLIKLLTIVRWPRRGLKRLS